MKISITITGLGSLNDLLDSPLIWESNCVPLIGDSLEYCNSDETIDFRGKVVERIFTIGTNEVLIDVEVDDKTYYELSDYLEKFRAKKREIKMTNIMDKYNKILVHIHDDEKFEDYYIQVHIGGTLSLDREELNKLAKVLWDYSWEIPGTFLAENSKYRHNWVFEFPRGRVVIEEVAQNLLQYLEPMFPNKVGFYE